MLTKNYSLDDYWKGVLVYAEKHPKQRYPQAAFNYLGKVRPDLQGQVHGSSIDPFYVTNTKAGVWLNFVAFLRMNW